MGAVDFVGIKAAIHKWVYESGSLPKTSVLWDFRGGERPPAPWISLSIVNIEQPSHDWLTVEDNLLSGLITPGPYTITSVSTVDGKVAIASHPFLSGDGPFTLHSTGADYPAPWDDTTILWAIKADAGHIQLTDTFQKTGGNYVGNPVTPVVPTTTGSGLTLLLQDDAVRAGIEITRRARGIRVVNFRVQCFGADKSGTQPMEILQDVISALPLYVYELDLAGVGMSSLGVADVDNGVKMVEGRRGGILEPRAVVEMSAYVGSEAVGTIGRIDRVQVTPVAVMEDGAEVSLPPVWIPE